MTLRSLMFMPQNTSRTHCLCKPLLCATPNIVATTSSNALRPKKISHELAASFSTHRASCFHMQWPSILHQQSANAKVTQPAMHLKRFVKFHELEHRRQRQLALKLPKDLVTRFIPLLGQPFLPQVGQGWTIIKFNVLLCNGHLSCINIRQW